MARTLTLTRTQAAGSIALAFVFGIILSGGMRSPVSSAFRLSGPATKEAKLSAVEERGPPTKEELGLAGWTLLHTTAATFPDQPTTRQRARIESFLRGVGELYPCPDCAAHFREFMAKRPVESGSRQSLSLWMCAAHNEVRKRQKKEEYYCDIGILDARWKDCGCDKSKNGTASERDAESPRNRRPRGRRYAR